MVARYAKIVVEGPFRRAKDPVRDAQQSQVTLETIDRTRRFTVIASGPFNPVGMSEEAWQDLMGWLTVLEVSKWHPDDLPDGDGVEFPIRLLQEDAPDKWQGGGVEAYVRTRLPEYELASEKKYRWEARARARG